MALGIHSALGDGKACSFAGADSKNGTGMHRHDRDGLQEERSMDLPVLQPYDEPYQIYGAVSPQGRHWKLDMNRI